MLLGEEMRALLVDDDPASLRLARAAIEPRGFLVETASTGEDALELARVYDFDVALLDLRLPDIDGGEVVRKMRAGNVVTPAVMVSVAEDRAEKVRCLFCGADDYLTKPFDPEELTARLKAVVRRSKGHAGSVIRTGRLAIDLATRQVEVDGKPLSVTPKEYGILELLSLRRGTTLTKAMFLDHLYGGMDEPEQKIVDVFICKLRKKIAALCGEAGIETVWGHGYVLRDPSTPGLAEAASGFDLDDPDALAAAGAGDDELDLLLLTLLPSEGEPV